MAKERVSCQKWASGAGLTSEKSGYAPTNSRANRWELRERPGPGCRALLY
jgi:hypothetical protein